MIKKLKSKIYLKEDEYDEFNAMPFNVIVASSDEPKIKIYGADGKNYYYREIGFLSKITED